MKKVHSHRKPRRKPSKFDGNPKVPEVWTNLLIEEVGQLAALPSPGAKVNYLHEQLLKKFCSDDTDAPELRRERAISKWLEQESLNFHTNARLETTSPEYNILPRVRWDKWLMKFRSMISDLLGESPPFEEFNCSFSGGASTSKSRTESHPASKYLGTAHITRAALPWFERALTARPGWERYKDDLSIDVVTGNVMFTVPKSATIDRAAAKEPDLNMYLQKGAGNLIRRALKTRGIDLNDQSRNQRLARDGSISGNLATMDLSSASDSVTRTLCWLALPIEWFRLLDDIRSPFTMIDGVLHESEMFSSMGNGFTFELESLLFYVIAKTTAWCTGTKGVISIYGDDIICPSELYNDLSYVLSYLGFRVNPDKSFNKGPFRESCGGHYFNGCDVTPIYLKAPVKKLTDLIRLGNQIRRWSSNSTRILDSELEELWMLIRDEVPQGLWGGRDLGSITQLVTPGLSRFRLVEIKENQEHTGDGGFILWLNSSDGRTSLTDGLETSQRDDATAKYRLRPVKYCGFRPLAQIFLSEL